jgi:hypothetical protein
MEMPDEPSRRTAVLWVFQTTPLIELLWELEPNRHPETRFEAAKPINKKVDGEGRPMRRPSKNGGKGRKVTIFWKK